MKDWREGAAKKYFPIVNLLFQAGLFKCEICAADRILRVPNYLHENHDFWTNDPAKDVKPPPVLKEAPNLEVAFGGVTFKGRARKLPERSINFLDVETFNSDAFCVCACGSAQVASFCM